MAIFPPESDYQNRINSAWLKHVAGGLRSELVDDGIPNEATDEDVVRFYRDTYAADSPPHEFEAFLTDTYNPTFKAPGRTLMENVGGLVKGVAEGAPSMGRQIVEQVGAESLGGMAKGIPAKIGQGARMIGAPLLGTSYLARILAQVHAGNEISQIAENIPAPDVTALQKHYFESLAPSLEARGYTMDQIANEVQKRVGNVVRGYTATQNSLMGELETTSDDVLNSAAEGVANISLLGAGSGLFKKALLAGAKRAAGEKGAKAVTSTVAGRLISHAVPGAALGGAAGGLMGAVEGGARAQVQGESPVAGAVGGATRGAIAGAGAGAVLGGPLGVAIEAIGRKAVVDAAMQNPKAPEPLLEAAVGDMLPVKQPLEILPTTSPVQEPPVGSQAWWDLYHGVEKPVSPLQKPLGLEPSPTPVRVGDVQGPALEGTPRGGVEPLELPRASVKPAVQKGTNPNEEIRSISTQYNEGKGIPRPATGEYHPFDPEKARRIAAAYEEMPATPQTPEAEAATRASYEALNREIEEQYQALLKAGYEYTFSEKDPSEILEGYNSARMLEDLKNKKLLVFSGGEPHPYMTPEQTMKFRAVHDTFGHGAEGFQFGPRGEDNAWRKHAQMFSPEAIPALTTETRGQNSWVNFREGHEALDPSERPFAQQKAGLLPSWTYEEVLQREVPQGPLLEPRSISLPTESVQQIVESVKTSGGKIEGAQVSVRPNADGSRLVIDSLKGAEHGTGASGKALDRIVATADQEGIPLEVTVTDYAGPRGGRISAEKVAQWYERRGFVRSNVTSGAISLHRPVPDPNPPLTSEQIGALAEHHIGEATAADEAAQLETFLARAEGLSEPRAFEALGNVAEGEPMIRATKPGEWKPGDPFILEEGQTVGTAGPDVRIRRAASKVLREKLSAQEGRTVWMNEALQMARENPELWKLVDEESLVRVAKDDPMLALQLQRLKQGSGQPSVGMRLGSWLDQQAAEADKRINDKLGRMGVGFDPTLIGDFAIKAAAKMYRLGLTAYKSITAEMRRDHPDIPDDEMKEIVRQAREIINSRLKGDKVSVTTLTRLLQAAEEGRAGADWYDKTAGAVQKMFGEDSDMMLRFLAATSAGKSADANVTLALKAYGQWKLGLPFDGFIGNDQMMLEKAARGEVFGERKLQSILAALRGDENAVAIDRHVMRALGFAKAGAEKGSMTDREYDFFEAVIRDLATQRGMTPRQFQAALWTSAKIRQAQTAKTPREMAHLHSFRPYEGIMKHEHDLGEGGMTPVQWVDENRVTLNQLYNASQGVTQTRAGGGFTYDPLDYTPFSGKEGFVTTLASVKIPTNKLSGSEVIGFAKKWKQLLDNYPGMNIGTFNLEQAGEAGVTSMDLNIVLPESMREIALKLAAGRKQHSIWDLGAEQAIETGFKGVTADAPSDPKARGQWWRQQRAQIDEIMANLGVPTRESKQLGLFGEPEVARAQLQAMMQQPHAWGAIASQTLGVTEKELKQLVDQGRIKPVSDAGMLDHVEVHKDGTIWEYVDPTAPSYNIMKLVGMLRGSKAGEMLNYLEGKNIVSGHDVVQSYRSQAGFARLPSKDIKAFARRAPIAAINKALTSGFSEGNSIPASKYRYTSPTAASIWLTPDGKIIEVLNHLRSAVQATKKLKLKNPVKYTGPENEGLQRLLNHGYMRVQVSGNFLAVDSTVPLTASQVLALRELRRGANGVRAFAGRLTNADGEHRAMYSDYESGKGSFNRYVSESRGE